MRTELALAITLSGCAAVEPDLSSTQQATTVCAAGPTVQGMDVSAYETSIDWNIAHANGIDFAFIRATDGTQYFDPAFPGYWSGARAAGVIRGAYQFFRPSEDPIAQADLLLSTMGPLQPGDLPPVIDVETTGGLAPGDVAAAVRAWVDHVTVAIGRPPIIYAGFYSWQDDTGGLNMSTYPLWHAQYTTAPCPNIPVPWTKWLFWQDSDSGVIPSVDGETTDLDVFNGTLADLQAFAANGLPPCGPLPAAGGEIDRGDACFSDGGPPDTLREVAGAGEHGDLVWTHTTTATVEGNFAQWDLEVSESGSYRVEVYTDTAYAQSTKAAYTVAGASSTRQTVVIDQSAVNGWQALGNFDLDAANTDQFVHLGDDTGEAGAQLVFDAVRLTRLDDTGSDGSGGGSGSGSDRSGPVANPDGAGCSTGSGPRGLGGAVLVAAWCATRRRSVIS